MRSIPSRLLAFLLAFAAAVLPPLSCGCGSALLPAIRAAVDIADRALDVIAQVEEHVSPQLEQVPAAVSQPVLDAITKARAAAEEVRTRGRAAQQGDYERALDGLEQALAELFRAGAPLGVRQLRDGAPAPLLGAQADGTLGVQSPAEIVRGPAS